jgi:hypothetical protein
MRQQFSLLFFCLLITSKATFSQNLQYDFFSRKAHILLPKDFVQAAPENIEIVRQLGIILFWMTLTTIGVCLSIKPERITNINQNY